MLLQKLGKPTDEIVSDIEIVLCEIVKLISLNTRKVITVVF